MIARKCLIGKRIVVLGWLLVGVLVACNGQTTEADLLTVPTPIAKDAQIIPEQALAEATSLPATATSAPTATHSLVPTQAAISTEVTSLTPPATETAVVLALPEISGEAIYQVAFVASNDVLNVRSAAGVENDVSGSFPANAQGIHISGPGQQVSGSLWVPVTGQEAAGWVNGRFLTGQFAGGTFCQDTAVLDLLGKLETAVANEDGALLAQLVHPERGLRLRSTWWNPEVRLGKTAVATLYEDTTSIDWGIEDGSGQTISGSFRDLIQPLLQKDLLAPSSTSCNQIEHGATAGSVQLPDGYQHVNYLSTFRAPGDDLGFDWGTWVVGIEKWQSEIYLSFLVHYEYEI